MKLRVKHLKQDWGIRKDNNLNKAVPAVVKPVGEDPYGGAGLPN